MHPDARRGHEIDERRGGEGAERPHARLIRQLGHAPSVLGDPRPVRHVVVDRSVAVRELGARHPRADLGPELEHHVHAALGLRRAEDALVARAVEGEALELHPVAHPRHAVGHERVTGAKPALVPAGQGEYPVHAISARGRECVASIRAVQPEQGGARGRRIVQQLERQCAHEPVDLRCAIERVARQVPDSGERLGAAHVRVHGHRVAERREALGDPDHSELGAPRQAGSVSVGGGPRHWVAVHVEGHASCGHATAATRPEAAAGV